MSRLIRVEPESFVAASSALGRDVADAGHRVLLSLAATLDSCAGMAGDDPSGASWAGSYDAAVATTLGVSADAVNACYRLAALLEQTGFNYSAAESASTPGAVWDMHPDVTRWNDIHVSVPAAPPAAGSGSAAHPPGFPFVAQMVGGIWPNGHQDRLHRAADAWARAATGFETLADIALQADACIRLEDTPESPAAVAAVRSMRSQLLDIARVQRALEAACNDYAHHLDQAHSEAISELRSLLEWTVAIEAGGALLSVVTFGLSEGAAQAAEATRIAEAVAKITAIINRLQAFATVAGDAIISATRSLEVIAGRLRGLLEARAIAAGVDFVRDAGVVNLTRGGSDSPLPRLIAEAQRRGLPDVRVTRAQVESHYYHAAALGVTLPRGRAGFIAMQEAIETFIKSPTTIRIYGRYHGDEVVLNFNRATKQVVIQYANGEFLSAWKMGKRQLWWVIKRGKLGGG